MSIEIRLVETRRDLDKFIKFQFDHYRGNPYAVPPLVFDELNTLRKDKNPAFEFCDAEYWLAYKDGKIVGRIAGIHNERYVEKWGLKNARFGWIEFIDDYAVSEALLRTVEDWARSKGMEGIVGPMGFTDSDKEGMLVEGFEELGTMPMIYNHPYYQKHLERLGYAKEVDWLEFEVKVPEWVPEKALRVQELISKRSGVHLYEWKSKKELVTKFGKPLFKLLDEAYAGLFGTVPLTERQVDAYIKQYLGFVDPRFTKLVVDEKDELIAFGVAMPSLSHALQKARGRVFPLGWIHILKALRKPEGLDMYLVAVKKEYQSRGVIAFMMTSLTQDCIKAGIKTAETAGELESNHAVQSLWKDFERRQHKRRRAYFKKL
ncbi:MAG: N-acetyltransferase [Spirochaetaceae bacterium]|nr:N-acetyltransferase [Spirochaetaceae bacterium]